MTEVRTAVALGAVRSVWTLIGSEGPSRGLEMACVFAQLVSTCNVHMTNHGGVPRRSETSCKLPSLPESLIFHP